MWIESDEGELINTSFIERLCVDRRREHDWRVIAVLRDGKPVVIEKEIDTVEKARGHMFAVAESAMEGIYEKCK